MDDREFSPRRIEWTTEKARHLWSWIASQPSYDTESFAYLAGDQLIAFARRSGVPLSGRILDYGCGPGFLLEKLLKSGASCSGVDFSNVAADSAIERLSKYERFLGVTLLDKVPTGFASGEFSAVFMLETIEHILDQDLSSTVRELNRIIGPAGHLIVSTPNEERLEGGETMCPECGSIYHRSQHVQRWSAARLTSFMANHGFRTIACQTRNLRPPSRLNVLRDAVAAVTGARPLNLIYVGQKAR